MGLSVNMIDSNMWLNGNNSNLNKNMAHTHPVAFAYARSLAVSSRAV
jgi:hypothetical protein